MPTFSTPRQNKSLTQSKTVQDVAQFWLYRMEGGAEQVHSVLGHLTVDSRQVTCGDVFIALQGHTAHGLDYLTAVLNKQPGLVISDRALSDEENQRLKTIAPSTEVWVIEGLSQRLGDFADWFYHHPSQRIKVVGITGTNGKTSTAFYTAQLLQKMGQTVALMGTLGNGLMNQLQPSANTTPDAISVQRLLAQFAEQGAQWVVMEVSSHALVLQRIQAVHFNTVALTQVTRDHLDFHQTEQAYHAAKKMLFTDYLSQHKVINADDSLGLLLKGQFLEAGQESVWAYGISSADVSLDMRCSQFELQPQGLLVYLGLPGQEQYAVNIALMGGFNVQNVLCALSILLVNKFSWTPLRQALADLSPVSGRMQRVALQPRVVVDFAHTPDALEQLLAAVQGHLVPGPVSAKPEEAPQLWLVFGCGGNRDAGKRPLMAKVAQKMADKIIITNDNPRFESPQAIVDDILQGFSASAGNVRIELDRQKAIESALQLANPNDVVVIAGKGHETYQDIEGVKTPFSDEQIVVNF
ncbi:UDP-N-acetylmuramoyl-L-alanyl-D-glutamate--2,6-diaminopimelate ligase [Thiomicrorhabdus aquaedulcis]|uniref:UDP-N-acetylmuramoyl-L-alanyl-D-glutamate--2, 6-diaminopimelate ligase n=1 Tax=Thiomicrorhabdus aquaedulcis TaxID=2211106 RepID=UPI0015622782|nr:UDP-N-acetylmuramoyl-L-alanyl-D-glutamate--2,6-diaminopimelate ligase [Thiomicrorhabdus aquaedulcis]